MKTAYRLIVAFLVTSITLGVLGCVAWMADSGAMSNVAMAGMNMTAPASVVAANDGGQLISAAHHALPMCEGCQIVQHSNDLPIFTQLSVFHLELPALTAALLQIIVVFSVIILSTRPPPDWRTRPDLVSRRLHRAVVIVS